MQQKPYKRFFDLIAQTETYQLPMRCYEFFGVETVNQEYVVITARCHPGETLQSYVLSRFLDCLVRNGCLVNTTVLVLPLLNVDGVYRGNYRTDCFGRNLNRTYAQPGPGQAVNQAVSGLVQSILSEHKIRMIIDLHNHATLQSLVCFGNDLVGEELARHPIGKPQILQFVRQQQRLQRLRERDDDAMVVRSPVSQSDHDHLQKSHSQPLSTKHAQKEA